MLDMKGITDYNYSSLTVVGKLLILNELDGNTKKPVRLLTFYTGGETYFRV